MLLKMCEQVKFSLDFDYYFCSCPILYNGGYSSSFILLENILISYE